MSKENVHKSFECIFYEKAFPDIWMECTTCTQKLAKKLVSE